MAKHEITTLNKPYRIEMENGKYILFDKIYKATERLKQLRQEGRKVNLYLHFTNKEPQIIA